MIDMIMHAGAVLAEIKSSVIEVLRGNFGSWEVSYQKSKPKREPLSAQKADLVHLRSPRSLTRIPPGTRVDYQGKSRTGGSEVGSRAGKSASAQKAALAAQLRSPGGLTREVLGKGVDYQGKSTIGGSEVGSCASEFTAKDLSKLLLKGPASAQRAALAAQLRSPGGLTREVLGEGVDYQGKSTTGGSEVGSCASEFTTKDVSKLLLEDKEFSNPFNDKHGYGRRFPKEQTTEIIALNADLYKKSEESRAKGKKKLARFLSSLDDARKYSRLRTRKTFPEKSLPEKSLPEKSLVALNINQPKIVDKSLDNNLSKLRSNFLKLQEEKNLLHPTSYTA